MTADPEASGAVPVSDPSPAGPADRSALMLVAGACWLASAVCITVMAARGASVAWIIAWVTAAAAAVAVTRTADLQLSRRHSSRVIVPSSLDDSGRWLLRRAQRAIAAILRSELCTADLLDRAAAQAALTRHEWDIASTLRDIAALRAESGTSLPGASPGPMTGAVVESHRRALTLAEQATTARVCALERYAAQVRVTDAARLDWQNALKIAGLNDRYLDLLARTAADDQAIAEITTLPEQASAADEAFRESLHRATIAAEPLVLPGDDEPSQVGDAHPVATPGQPGGDQIPGGAPDQRAMNQQQPTTHALFVSTFTTPAPPYHTEPSPVRCGVLNRLRPGQADTGRPADAGAPVTEREEKIP